MYKVPIAFDKFLILISICIGSYFILWHTADTDFDWYHDSTVAIQATIADNWLSGNGRTFYNGEKWASHPPFPILLAATGQLSGISLLLRLIPLLFSLGTIISWFYFIKIHCDDRKLAYEAAWALFINPLFIFFAPVLNYEQPAFFFLTFGLLSYERFIKGEKRFWLLALAVSFAGAGFTEWQAGIIAVSIILDWKRTKWKSVLPLFFTSLTLAISLYLSAINDSLIASAASKMRIEFLSLEFWFVLLGRASSLFTLPGLILGIYFWITYIKKINSRIIIGLGIAAFFLLLALSRWFYIHNFALYYFILPLTFGTGFIINRLPYNYKLPIRTVIISSAIFSLYFMSIHRESIIGPLCDFQDCHMDKSPKEFALDLRSREYILAYRQKMKYTRFFINGRRKPDVQSFILAPLVRVPKNKSNTNFLQNNYKEVQIDRATVYLKNFNYPEKCEKSIQHEYGKVYIQNDTVCGCWVILNGVDENDHYELRINDKKVTLFPGNRSKFDMREEKEFYYHWFSCKSEDIEKITRIRVKPRYQYITNRFESAANKADFSSFELLGKFSVEFGYPLHSMLYKKEHFTIHSIPSK